MSWFFPFSDSWKKRACRYLLQRYLGQFLEEKLTLDQMSVDLYNGTGSVSDVSLDVQGLNELAEQQSLPLEFVDGYIGEMSVSIPWATILRDSSYVQITGLVLTVQPKQRAEEMGAGSLFESMISMTSSIQLATEIQQTEPSDTTEQDSTQNVPGQTIEGIELIAKTLDSILCKIKVKFVDTTIRLEHVPKGSKTGVALEIHIRNMDYCDEAGCDATTPDSPSGGENAFAVKKFHMDGLSIYTDEFPTSARTVSRRLLDSQDEGGSPSRDFADERKTVEPVLFGKLVGRQELRVKVKQAESIPGPKVDVEINMGSLLIFSTPRQIHLIQELMHGLATPGIQDSSNVVVREKRMNKTDFERVGLDLLNQLHPGAAAQKENKSLHNIQGWSAADPDEDSDEEFHPISGVGASLGGSLASSMDSSTMSSISGGHTAPYARLSKRKRYRGSSSDPEPGSDRSHYTIRLSSLSLVLLHEDIIISGDSTGPLASSVRQLNSVSEEFFQRLSMFAVSAHGNKDFREARQVFLNAVKLNHVRLLAAPVMLDLDEKESTMSATLTGGSVELLECLVEESNAQNPVYIELLKFMREDGENKDPTPKHPITQQPDVKIKIKHSKKTSRSSMNSLDLSIHLEQCWSEVDVSISDRISTLLNPKPLCSIPSQYKSDNTMQSVFDQAMENCTDCDSRLEWKVTSSYVVIKLRFPIPDLRPPSDPLRLPHWQVHLHGEICWFHLSDVIARSSLTSRQLGASFELSTQRGVACFQEAGSREAVPFAFTSYEDTEMIHDVGWPRLVIRMYSPLTFDLEDPLDEPSNLMSHSIVEPPLRQPSPFTYRKVFHDNSGGGQNKAADPSLYEGEELVLPGDKEEINNFIDDTCRKALIQVDIQLPTAYLQFPNKHIYELIYNRFTSDLLLWAPSSPASQKWTQNINVNYNNVFSMYKDPKDSDSDVTSEEEGEQEGEGGIFYSMHEHRTRKSRLKPVEPNLGQSKLTLSLSVSQCVIDMYSNVKDSNGVQEDGLYGQVMVLCEDLRVFSVSKYKGKTGNSFVIVQINNGNLYHSNKVQSRTLLVAESTKFPPACDHLLETIYRSDESSILTSSSQPVACGPDSLDMLTVAIHIYYDERQVKMNRVSCSLRGASLRHRMTSPHQNVFSQLIDLFDVIDYPVFGYEPLPIVVEYHQHFIDCSLDYRPLYLPYSCLVSLGSFSICCNLAARTTSSTLRFIAEDISLFLSSKTVTKTVDLKQDYVCVLEIGLFELSLRISDAPGTPRLHLSAWNNIVHIRTCADSTRALLLLISYLASEGDLRRESATENEGGHIEEGDLKEGEVKREGGEEVQELMAEAMQETVPVRTHHNSGSDQQVEMFLFPNEGRNDLEEEELDLEDDYLDKEFCFLENEAGSGYSYQTKEPEVHMLISSPIRLIDNHFCTPLGKTDLLQPPKHFPTPAERYTLRETSIVWTIYKGQDFGTPPSSATLSPCRHNSVDISFRNHRSSAPQVSFVPRRESIDSIRSLGESPTKSHSGSYGEIYSHAISEARIPARWQERGGVGRKHDVKMELQLNKLRFQHDLYPAEATQSSRQVILIHDVEIRDRLASSNINTFLYAYSSKARPRQSHAHMVVLKALHVKSEQSAEELESCMKVSMLPLRLNIDQDAILFLFNFASELSADIADDKDNLSDTASVTSVESSPSISSSTKKSPIFIKSFVFSPEVLIRLDYQGKHVDMSHGPLAGILMGLAQLNCSEIRLKKINHRHGLLGLNKLLSFVQAEWSQDIYKNQLPSLLGGVGPMYSLVQLAQGIRDLFWLPIEQYQKDGRIVRGLQRGANSFTTSTAMAALELTARIVMAIQTVAETAFDMVSPGPSVRRQRQNSNKKKQRHHNQPVDIREGLTNALTLMREGLDETAQTLLRVASEEHEAKGTVGAVGGVIRQIPSTAIRPIIIATEATTNVLGGVKSQLVPDARKEAAHKWRTAEL